MWFDKNVKSAAQDEDHYRRLLKMKTEGREGLHSAFENHVARVAEKVERLRVVHDAVVKHQQDSLHLDLQAQADFLCLWPTDSPVSSPAGGVLEFALTVS